MQTSDTSEVVTSSASPERRWLLLRWGGLAAALLLLGWLGIGAISAPLPPLPEPTPTPWPVPVQFAEPVYGVNVHLWWDPWAAVGRDWNLISEAGLTWVKQRLTWQDVEGAGPGRYEWSAADRLVAEAEEYHLNLIFRVDLPPVWALPADGDTEYGRLPVKLAPWRAFCHTLADRYRGRVRGYQVWNEPNLAREWGGQVPDPAGYVELLRACYVGIKEADPEALVISAGLAPTGSGPPEALPDTQYLVGMYEAGAAPYFDLLGLNAPGYKAPPELAPSVAADPESGYGGHLTFCFRHVENMRALMEEYGDGEKQVAILEFGWHVNTNPDHAAYTWFAVTPEEQGEYLVRAMSYAQEHWTPWVGPMFIWNFPDPHWTPEQEEFWWGIVDPFWWGYSGDFGSWRGAEVRPAYEAVKEFLIE